MSGYGFIDPAPYTQLLQLLVNGTCKNINNIKKTAMKHRAYSSIIEKKNKAIGEDSH